MKNYESKEIFDITIAIGVFDYIRDLIPFHEKMKALSKKKMIASYPAKNTFQMPLRKIWLWTKKCPVYFFTEKKIKSIYQALNITNYEVLKISAGYFVKAYIN